MENDKNNRTTEAAEAPEEKKFILQPGDTAYYNCVVKHSVRAVGGKSARIYGIVFVPA